jgi:F-type H+-transporting ATPase subunit epsilon
MSQNIPSQIELKVVVPTKMLVDTEADEVELPGLEGYIGILPGHRELTVALGEGEITYRRGSHRESFSVQGGYAEITPTKILVISTEKEKKSGQEVKKGG